MNNYYRFLLLHIVITQIVTPGYLTAKIPLLSHTSEKIYTYIVNKYKNFDKKYIHNKHIEKQKKYLPFALFCVAAIPTSITLLHLYNRFNNTKEENKPNTTVVENKTAIAIFTHDNMRTQKQLTKEYQENLAALHELRMKHFTAISKEYREKLATLDIQKDSIDTFDELALEYNQAVFELNQQIKQIQRTINSELQLKLNQLNYADPVEVRS